MFRINDTPTCRIGYLLNKFISFPYITEQNVFKRRSNIKVLRFRIKLFENLLGNMKEEMEN